jgi:hypothetical protein
VMLAVPFVGSAVAEDVRTIVEPEGAKRGTISQPAVRSGRASAKARKTNRWIPRAIMKPVNILVP